MERKYLIVLAFCLTLLVGCTSQEYKESVKLGKEAMMQNNYKVAIVAFHKATELEPKETKSQKLYQQALVAQEQVLRADIGIAITNHKLLIDKEEWNQAIKVISDIEGNLSGYEATFAKEMEQLKQLKKQSIAGKEIVQGREKLNSQLFDQALKYFESSQKLVDSDEAKSMITETLKLKSAYEETQKKLAFAIKNVNASLTMITFA